MPWRRRCARANWRLAEAGIEPSVGSKGDSHDNALAETLNGQCKPELIHRRAIWTTTQTLALAMPGRVVRLNNHHRLEPIGCVPPAKAKANCVWQLARQTTAVAA